MTACVSCLLETPFSNVTRASSQHNNASPETKGHAHFRECAVTGTSLPPARLHDSGNL